LKKFFLISLGCSKNLVDSEQFFSLFLQLGYKHTSNKKYADIILINTCGFIQDAKEEAINTILDTAELKKKNLKKLIVTGCLVKRYKESLITEIPEVDVWIDLKDFEHLKTVLKKKTKSTIQINSQREILTPEHYAYLRISDGCDNHCSYCTIPSIRGKLTSEKLENLLKEAQYLADQGVKELIINAQDTTKYGYDLYGKSMLIELLKEIEKMKLFPWIRLLYLHPAHLSKKMIEDFKDLKTLLPYFDIPLQHINSSILKAMNRKIDKETIIENLNFLRQTFPHCAIRTTFITGFPGESRLFFAELENFINDFKFTRLGVFAYSQEEDTPAIHLPRKVLDKTAQKRKDTLMFNQMSISRILLSDFVGKTLDVIIDKKIEPEEFSPIDTTTPHGKLMKGFRDEFIHVFNGRSYLDAPEIDGRVLILVRSKNIKKINTIKKNKILPGDIVKVKILFSLIYDLVGEIL